MKRKAIVAGSRLGIIAGISVGVVLAIAAVHSAAADSNSHTVVEGESLSGISEFYGVDLDALVEINGIANADLITLCQQLVIPEPQPLSSPDVENIVSELSAAEGLDPNLVKSVAWIESRWQQEAVSPAGAVGVMQLMPTTVVWLEKEVFGHPLNESESVYDNIKGGVRLLRILFQATGDLDLTLASYYRGYGATTSGIMYDDTVEYVEAVHGVQAEFWPASTEISTPMTTADPHVTTVAPYEITVYEATNVRNRPSTNSEIIGPIFPGEHKTVVGKTRGEWVESESDMWLTLENGGFVYAPLTKDLLD